MSQEPCGCQIVGEYQTTEGHTQFVPVLRKCAVCASAAETAAERDKWKRLASDVYDFIGHRNNPTGDLDDDLRNRLQGVVGEMAERDALRKSVMNQCGDNMCWLDPAGDNDIPSKALPEGEFLESCRRYRNQMAAIFGELQVGQMTIAQLEAECERLRAVHQRVLEAGSRLISRWSGMGSFAIDPDAVIIQEAAEALQPKG